MIEKVKKFAAVLLISSSLVMTSIPAFAEDAQTITEASMSSYALTDSLRVEVKGVLNEKTSDGIRLGAVIRLRNDSGEIVRIPEFEFRVTTNAGVVYTLKPSSANPHGVQPQSEEELSYMKLVDRKKEVQLTDISLVDVNLDYYPKLETTLVTLPIASLSWNGSHADFTDPAAIRKWGDHFIIPSVESPLVYTPISFTKSYTAQGAVALVKLLVENPTQLPETIPAFAVDGKTAAEVYSGKRVEQGAVVLDSGKKRYIHYAIQTEMDTELSSLNVLTSELFHVSPQSVVNFLIGKLSIVLPTSAAEREGLTLGEYTYKTPIAFEPWNDFINPNLEVSLVELHISDNEEAGNKAAVAKFKLNNKGALPLPVPTFQTELTSLEGFTYSGIRQKADKQDLMPGTSSLVSYAFTMPATESGEHYSLKLLDDKAAAPYKSAITAYRVTTQSDDDAAKLLSFYPFAVTINEWTLSPSIMPTLTKAIAYTYKLRINLDIVKDNQVVVDNGSSRMKLELFDFLGKSLGSKYYSFTGTNRLVSGVQVLTFDNLNTEQIENGVTIKVYESIDTLSGEVNRYLTTLK